jgi:hypothetical protein
MDHRTLDATEVELVIEHALRDSFGVGHLQAHRYLRLGADEATEQVTHEVVADGVASADAQLACEGRAPVAGGAGELGVPFQQFLRQGQQFASARREPQASARAIEHGGAEQCAPSRPAPCWPRAGSGAGAPRPH